MIDFIERRYVERVPEEELNTRDKPVWYLPHPSNASLEARQGEVGSWLCSKVMTNISKSVAAARPGSDRSASGCLKLIQTRKEMEEYRIVKRYLVLHLHQV